MSREKFRNRVGLYYVLKLEKQTPNEDKYWGWFGPAATPSKARKFSTYKMAALKMKWLSWDGIYVNVIEVDVTAIGTQVSDPGCYVP